MAEHPFTAVRVGLLGASNIAKQVWRAVAETGHTVTFIGCRSVEKGEAYRDALVKELGIAAEEAPAVGSYEDCVSSDAVDVVYIAIPVTSRDRWVRECVANNKHVIGEKPPAESAEMLRGWVEALDARQLLYMDGTMLSHGERVGKVAELVASMGPVKHIFSNFSFNGGDAFLASDIRCDPALEPHGALGDLGWYNIRYILHVMNFAMPEEVTGRIVKQNEKGGIIEFSGELTFRDAATGETAIASLFCAFDVAPESTIHIATKSGVVEVFDFVHCVSGTGAATWRKVHSVGGLAEGKCTQFTRTRTIAENSTAEDTKDQKNAMWRNIGEILYRDEADGGRLKAREEEARHWATIAWKTQAVMDKMLQSARQNTHA